MTINVCVQVTVKKEQMLNHVKKKISYLKWDNTFTVFLYKIAIEYNEKCLKKYSFFLI